jgi:hypothetical protein
VSIVLAKVCFEGEERKWRGLAAMSQFDLGCAKTRRPALIPAWQQNARSRTRDALAAFLSERGLEQWSHSKRGTLARRPLAISSALDQVLTIKQLDRVIEIGLRDQHGHILAAKHANDFGQASRESRR